MRAAVVTSFDNPPGYLEFPDPVSAGPDGTVVHVLATALHPRVRSQADGSHYTSTDELPLVPGIDGVGRTSGGELRYFILPDTMLGAMAQRTTIDIRRSVPLPDDADPIALAAGMNPAMSSWLALRRRVTFEPGQTVLVLGATGSAGRMAVQVARLFGAGRVVAAGRNADRLAALTDLGADETISLTGTSEEIGTRLAAAAADTDVVLDYVWGELTTVAMTAIVTARPDRDRPLTWIEIGSVGGPTASIPSAALRAARLQIVGSGQGSVATRDILAELPALATEITAGRLAVDTRSMPLSQVEQAWALAPDSTERIVLVP
jgi:NADPH:quinone reductase-like Zn-dependent oxidoreductase